jgi:DNA-binding response OmpR family regulator
VLLEHLVDERERVGMPERDDLPAALELGQEQDLVDQRAGVLDLRPCLVEQSAHIRARQVGRVEEREDPGERRPQLVRDGGGKAGAELVERHRRLRTRGPDGARVFAVVPVLSFVHQVVTISTRGAARTPVYRRDVAKILIVEDDSVIADSMARHLSAAGFDPVVVARGELGLARLRFETPDVCVLDLMLPELDGWKLIETARAEGIGTPIVVVSARGTEHDRVHALEIGADDYLVKPFSMRELVARVGAAARRGVRPAEERRGDAIEIEELRIDPREVQAYVDGASAELTPTEFKLLYTLALDRGRVVTRDELLQKVWGRRETHRDRTVDVFVRRLRQKIDSIAPQHSFIHTRFGVGYKLEPEPKA